MTKEQFIYIEVGTNVWGKGFTRSDAHRNAGKPTKYIVYATTDPWAYIDEMGLICYDGARRYWEIARKEPGKRETILIKPEVSTDPMFPICVTCHHTHYFEDDGDSTPWGECRQQCGCTRPVYA